MVRGRPARGTILPSLCHALAVSSEFPRPFSKFLNDAFAPDLGDGLYEFPREIVWKIDMSRPVEGAFSAHCRTQGAPMGASQAAEILNDFFARTFFRANHQRSNAL